MGTGTANLKSTAVTGDTLAAEMADDLALLVARADDETIYDLYDMEPPAAATSTNVNVGYIPLQSGPAVVPVALRTIGAQPLRAVRSSISNATPRRILSGTVDAQTVVSMPSAPVATKWGIELLYAQLAYVDPTDPSKGTQVSFHWATPPTYVNVGTAANVATIPANTSTTWNTPVAYVKNYYGQTAVVASDIMSATPGAGGSVRRRLRSAAGGIDARRAYTSARSAMASLAGAGTITTTATPAIVHKDDSETVQRTLKVPADLLGGTSGADVYFEVDDSRDWRNADFLVFANVPNLLGPATWYFGEEGTAGAAGTRQLPARAGTAGTAHASYFQMGQSFEAFLGAGSYARVAQFYTVGGDPQTVGPNQGAPWFADTDVVELVVDMSTGKLLIHKKIAGSAAGAPITIFFFATFPNNSR